jgi:hypothetical protein
MQSFHLIIRYKNMKTLTRIFIFFAIFILLACNKDSENMNHYETTNQKILNFNNKAFVGNWERIQMTTWDYKDNFVIDESPTDLKITKRHWITEGKKRDYTMNIYIPDSCNIYVTQLSLETNGTEIIVPFGQYGWDDHMRIWVYEYPDDPDIFRIDRRYKPAGFPD